MNAIQQRRSIRKYKDTPVDRAQIEELILAASLAPSAKNRQPWKYLVYTGDAKERFLQSMQEGLKREKERKSILPESAFGLPDAFHTLQVMREAPELIHEIGTEKQLVGAISVGYPAEAPLSRPRKPIEDILEYHA